MTRPVAALMIVLLVAGCVAPAPPNPPPPPPTKVSTSRAPIDLSPFVGVDLSTLSTEDREIIEKASEDFRAVQRGKKPIHAAFDENAYLPTDGGTTYYKGKRYTLTIQKAISSVGGLDGTMYGPVLTLDEKFAPGNAQTISDVRFYSDRALESLLAAGDGV